MKTTMLTNGWKKTEENKDGGVETIYYRDEKVMARAWGRTRSEADWEAQIGVAKNTVANCGVR